MAARPPQAPWTVRECQRSPESKAVSLRWCNDPSRPYQKLKGGGSSEALWGVGPPRSRRLPTGYPQRHLTHPVTAFDHPPRIPYFGLT